MKRVLSVVLTVAMLLTVLASFAAFADEVPDGTAIRSVTAFKRMDPEGIYYLANDIVIHGSWRFDAFRGTLDGQGHTIYLDHATMEGGLFAMLGGTSSSVTVIKNLNIVQLDEVTYTAANEGVAVLAARVDLGNTTIENVRVYANVVSDADLTPLGGLVGDARYCSLKLNRCVFSGSLTHAVGSESKDPHKNAVGGMVGKTWSTVSELIITECVNYGTLTAYSRVGGMFGYDYPKAKGNDSIWKLNIERCVNYGTIHSTFTHATDNGAGGLLGHHITFAYENEDFVLNNNINFGTILAANKATLGGIAGHVQISGVAGDAAHMKISGNINHGEVKTDDAENPENGSAMVGFYRTTTGGSITENSTRINNYHDDGIADAEFLESIGEKSQMKFTGTAYTSEETETILATLNAAYPDMYTLTADGKITLKWAEDAGYTSAFAMKIPTLEEIESGSGSEAAPMTLTLDHTIPAPTGTAISSATELAAMEANGVYYLANDIEITDTFASISDFAGILHGNGHVIVFNGAELRGGLFKSLAGGKIYDLTITEARGKDAIDDNFFRAAQLNENTLCAGTVAGYGYGTLVNVTADCAVGGALKQATNGYVGGLIGALTNGDTIIYGCKNIGKVVGGYAGGLVGLLSNNDGKVEISRSVNWGTVTSSTGEAGGIIAKHSAAVVRLLLLENVNYGAVSTTDSAYCGGILGMQKNLWDGSAYILRNINYGTVTDNFTTYGAMNGCPGGIIGRLDADSYAGATVSGNINYGSVVGNQLPNQLVAVTENDDGMTTAQNNFAVAGDVPATVGTINGTTVDDTAFATLNTAYAEVYAQKGEQIALKWAADANISETAPAISYTLVKQNDNNSGENGESGNTDQPAQPGQTNQPAQTEQPAQTQETAKKKKGCGSVLGSGAALALVLILGTGLTVCIRRKES